MKFRSLQVEYYDDERLLTNTGERVTLCEECFLLNAYAFNIARRSIPSQPSRKREGEKNS